MVEENLIDGIKLNKLSVIQSCDSCEYAKAHRKPIQKEWEEPQVTDIGEEVHSDLWGPSPVQTINGREYYVSYTDDAKRFSNLYLLYIKDQTLDAYKAYEAELNMQHNIHIKKLRTDHGEYLNEAFDKHLSQAGTIQILTVHDTPEYNGVSERLNWTLLEKVQAMMHASQLPKFLWREAMKHVVYLNLFLRIGLLPKL
jgi:hypothetical protein